MSSDYTGEEGGRATRRLLITGERPTAIIYDGNSIWVACSGSDTVNKITLRSQ